MTADEALQHFRAAEGGGGSIAGQLLKALRHPGVKRRIASTREGQLAIRAFHMLPACRARAITGPGVALPGIDAATLARRASRRFTCCIRRRSLSWRRRPASASTRRGAMLGFTPQFDFARGMDLTAQRWAAMGEPSVTVRTGHEILDRHRHLQTRGRAEGHARIASSRLRPGAPWEVVVVDNNSPDDTAAGRRGRRRRAIRCRSTTRSSASRDGARRSTAASASPQARSSSRPTTTCASSRTG